MANEYWEYKLPAGSKRPADNASNEIIGQFIKDKYVKKLFVPKGAIDPVAEYYANKDNPEFFKKSQPEPVPVYVKKTVDPPKAPTVVLKKIPAIPPKKEQPTVMQSNIMRQKSPSVIEPKPNITQKKQTPLIDLLDFNFDYEAPKQVNGNGRQKSAAVTQSVLPTPLKPTSVTTLEEQKQKRIDTDPIKTATPTLKLPTDNPIKSDQFYSCPTQQMYFQCPVAMPFNTYQYAAPMYMQRTPQYGYGMYPQTYANSFCSAPGQATTAVAQKIPAERLKPPVMSSSNKQKDSNSHHFA